MPARSSASLWGRRDGGAAAFGLAALLLLALSSCSGTGGEAKPPEAAPPTAAATEPKSTGPGAEAAENSSSVEARPGPKVGEAARQAAVQILSAVVTREAGNPKNAWALAHGMLAMGPEFKATDGRRALDVLGSDFLERDAFGPRFALKRDGRPVEPHQDLILKTLLELGFGLEEKLGPDATVGDLLAASRARFSPERVAGGLQFPAPNDAPWSVQAWCQGGAADETIGFESARGAVTHEEIAAALLGKLESETHFIRTALSTGRSFEKRKQGIFGYTCGGAHLFQGAAACVALGLPAKGNAARRMLAQVEQYLARIPVETKLVDEALRQRPQLAILLHNQDVKFLGHLIESLSKLQRDGLWTPNKQAEAILLDAEARLIANLVQLERSGAYRADRMAAFAANPDVFQLYLDLVGDAAHALSGMKLRIKLLSESKTPTD